MGRGSSAAVLAALGLAGCGGAGGGIADAPDPGGDQNAKVAAPPPHHKLFGFNSALSLWAVKPATEVKLERLAGARAQRFGVAWRTVQPQPGAQPFELPAGSSGAGQIARLDALYAELVRRGMTPI